MASTSTTRTVVVSSPSEPLVQAETTKKIYTREFMLGRRALSISLAEPECLKDFEHLRITKRTADVPRNARETVNVNRRPRYYDDNAGSRHNDGPSRVNSRADGYRSNGVRFHANNGNAQAERYRNNDRSNQRYDGFSGERRQYRPQENRFDFYRRPRDSERYDGNSRSYESNNVGFRNGRRFDDNGDGSRVNNTLPERETTNSRPIMRTVVHYSLARNGVVELSKSENAWIPSCRDAPKTTTTDEGQIEEIQKKVRSILNKITPENMAELAKSIVEMRITTNGCIKKIIELLFQKAIDEPSFSPQYAYICSQMKDIQVMSEDEVKKTSFRQLIILKCQKTFEMANAVEKNSEKSLSDIKSCEDQDLKKELQLKFDENERIQRKRSVGNCRFICELFKVKLLNSKVLQMCVRHLVKFPKEEPLECLCNILKHVGKDLNPENTFEKLQEYSSASYKTRISSRIRFMIQDIIDLKNNGWVPRNTVINPKTLKEIEEEFTMVPTNNRKSSKCTQPIEKPLNNYPNSTAQKVSSKSSNIRMKIESCSTTPQDNTSKQNVAHSNFEKSEVENSLLADNGQVELNTCTNAWVPRFRISQKTSEDKTENATNVEKTVESSIKTLNIEPDSSTTNDVVELEKIDPLPMTETDQNDSRSDVENLSPTPEGLSEVGEIRNQRTNIFSKMMRDTCSAIKLKCVDFLLKELANSIIENVFGGP